MKSTQLILGAAALLTLVAAKPAHAGHAYDDSYCREYTRSISIGGRTEDGYGRACLQQDGSWKVVLGQNAPEPSYAPPPRHDDRFVDDDGWNTPVVYYNRPRPIIYVSERPAYYVVRDHRRPKCLKHRHGHHDHGRGHGHGHGNDGWDD